MDNKDFNIKNYLKYLRFFSLIRSIRNGEVNRREIIISVVALVAIRLAIYLAMSHHLV